ncbi:Cytochrome P450 78A4 [Acorus calamus]|uniref:Cytochrome P450 78A4 n=1 Tax=Acorus calamus TaxID=4465 RepID=A0AAV9D301_ACOCL|nr:Cytochrome P450 78A4 [Acorus calamus]
MKMKHHLVKIITLCMLIPTLAFFACNTTSSWPLLLSLLFTLHLSLHAWLVPGGYAWRSHRSPAATPPIPGPVGWPLLGSIPIMGPLAHQNLARLSAALSASRLMAISLGPTRLVIASHPDTAREILCAPGFSNRPMKTSARLLMFERAIGFAPSGEYWRRLRRVAASGLFSPRSIMGLGPVRQKVAHYMCMRVGRERVVVVREVLQEGALNNMMGSLFGEWLGLHERGELVGMVREGYELIGEFNWEDYLGMGGLDFHGVGRRCKGLASGVKCLVGGIIRERRRKGEFGGDDFLGVLFRLPEEERLTDDDMIAVLWEMIFRGTDTIAILLEWAMARMVLHPEIQSKAQQEIDDNVSRARPIQDSDIPNLAYVQDILKEVLRMHPPGPLLSWARLAAHDVQVGKHLVPAGTVAMVNMWAIAHDKSIWTDPWAFKPKRFVEEEVSVMGLDLRLAPFGAGRRVCPGRAMGLATAHLWFARLLQEFDWGPARPVVLSERLRLSMEMKVPLVCRAVRRLSVE